jgi:hypothetical protein
MSQKRVEFLPFDTSTLNQLYHERYLDWIESGDLLLKKTRIHKEAYRKKICSSCSKKQQKKENVSNILLMAKNYKVVVIWILHVVKSLKKNLMNICIFTLH